MKKSEPFHLKCVPAKGASKISRSNASQFFVAGELCRRGLVAVVTLGNCPNTDILCSNEEGTKFAHIQVKTFRPADKTCSVGMKAGRNYGSNFFWILGGIPTMDSDKKPIYYVIPSAIVAKEVKSSHDRWLHTLGKKGQAHKANSVRNVMIPPHKSRWHQLDLTPYENRWDLILGRLG
jgi:hypothetical protein